MGGLSDLMESFSDPFGILDFAKDEYAANRDEKNMRATMDTQMAWGERMSNTAYQRAVTDMEAAGLNPMLAYGQGGAHTPGMPSSPNFGSRSTSGSLHSAAQTQNLREQTELVRAQKEKVIAETPGAEADSGRKKYEFENLAPVNVQSAEYDRDVKATAALLASLEYNVAVGGSVSKYSQLVHDHFRAKFRMLPVELRARMAETSLKELAAKAGREADKGYESFKRGAGNVGEALGKVTNSAADVVRSIQHGYSRFHSKAQYRRKYEFGH